MTVIDVHTHMFTTKWLDLLKQEGGLYNLKTRLFSKFTHRVCTDAETFLEFALEGFAGRENRLEI